MEGTITADAALAELLDVSTYLLCVALIDRDGRVLAELGSVGTDSAAFWAAADEAARLLGRPPVSQCEVGLPDARVFGVREQGLSAIAVADTAVTAGLIFYDLRETLRNLSGSSDARG